MVITNRARRAKPRKATADHIIAGRCAATGRAGSKGGAGGIGLATGAAGDFASKAASAEIGGVINCCKLSRSAALSGLRRRAAS
jgi:hypothetical protein